MSHRIDQLTFGEDTEELRDIKSKYKKHDHESWSPLEGTVAVMPQVYGNLPIGFYSAYFTDVTPITLVDLLGNRRHTL